MRRPAAEMLEAYEGEPFPGLVDSAQCQYMSSEINACEIQLITHFAEKFPQF